VAWEEEREVDAALARLPAHFREVIVLHHREHLTFAEIGRRTERSADAVRKVRARAVTQFQQLLNLSHEHS
jgi:RNA polymerase sigma factor (sigma-70 family)